MQYTGKWHVNNYGFLYRQSILTYSVGRPGLCFGSTKQRYKPKVLYSEVIAKAFQLRLEYCIYPWAFTDSASSTEKSTAWLIEDGWRRRASPGLLPPLLCLKGRRATWLTEVQGDQAQKAQSGETPVTGLVIYYLLVPGIINTQERAEDG